MHVVNFRSFCLRFVFKKMHATTSTLFIATVDAIWLPAAGLARNKIISSFCSSQRLLNSRDLLGLNCCSLSSGESLQFDNTDKATDNVYNISVCKIARS